MIFLFFDDFALSQNVAYSLLKNSFFNDKLSHAYLIDGNQYEYAFDFVLSFVKMIFCENHYSCFSDDNCKNCFLCNRIQSGNCADVKVIDSDSLVIKKEQLLELQEDFNMSSFEGGYRIYIIKDCDKMNKQASNSLLKFLEEPVDRVIAILITNRISRVMSTIVSRCQVIHLNNNIVFKNISSIDNFAHLYCGNTSEIDNFVNDDNKKNIFDCVLNFIVYFENNGLDIMLFMKKMWYNVICTRDDYLIAFKVMVYFYYDVLNFKIHNSSFLFCDRLSDIEDISSFNTLEMIEKKIDIIMYGYEMLLCNLNITLLLDDIIIKLGDVR